MLLADHHKKARVSLGEEVRGLVVNKCRADKSYVIKPSTKGATELVKEKLRIEGDIAGAGVQKKRWPRLKKQAKNEKKAQAEDDRLKASIVAKGSERNAMEVRLNSTKTLDDLKERESELQREKEEV